MMAEAGLPLLPGSRDPLHPPARPRRRRADRLPGHHQGRRPAAAAGAWRWSGTPTRLRAAFQQTAGDRAGLFGDGRVYVERYLAGGPARRNPGAGRPPRQRGAPRRAGLLAAAAAAEAGRGVARARALPDDSPPSYAPAAVRGALAAGYVGAGTFEFLLDPAGASSTSWRSTAVSRSSIRSPRWSPAWTWCASRSGSPRASRSATARTTSSIAGSPSSAGSTRRIRPGTSRRRPALLDRVRAAGRPVRPGGHARPAGLRGASALRLAARQGHRVGTGPRQAIARMDRALGEFRVEGPGVRTTIGFLRRVLAHPRFRGRPAHHRVRLGP